MTRGGLNVGFRPLPQTTRRRFELDQCVAVRSCAHTVGGFQSVDRAGERLTGRALTRRVVLAIDPSARASAAGLPPSTCCHTFRATSYRFGMASVKYTPLGSASRNRD